MYLKMDIVELGKTQRSMENREEIHEWLPKWTVSLQMMAIEQLLTDFPNTKAKEHEIFEYQEADSIRALRILCTRQSYTVGLTGRRFYTKGLYTDTKKAPGQIHGKKKNPFVCPHAFPWASTIGLCWRQDVELNGGLVCFSLYITLPKNVSHSSVCRFLPLERLMTMFSFPLKTGCILMISPTMTCKHLHTTLL